MALQLGECYTELVRPKGSACRLSLAVWGPVGKRLEWLYSHSTMFRAAWRLGTCRTLLYPETSPEPTSPMSRPRLRATGAAPCRCGARGGECGELGEWATRSHATALRLLGVECSGSDAEGLEGFNLSRPSTG